jgi:hypothetical protein
VNLFWKKGERNVLGVVCADWPIFIGKRVYWAMKPSRSLS